MENLVNASPSKDVSGVISPRYIIGMDFGLCAPSEEFAYVALYRFDRDTLLPCFPDAMCYALLEFCESEREVARTGGLKFRVFSNGNSEGCTLDDLIHRIESFK